ncbi:MAG: pseudouridine synthase [bacterium]|nr:pseudouridine synthase [bacterium]
MGISCTVPTAPSTSKLAPLLLFHKPTGYTCSKSDPHNPTFYELLPPAFKAYYYIGRLDKESRGLMLLTTDPHLVHEYEHPSKQIPKSYLVQLNHPFDRSKKAKILNGIQEG